MHRILSINPGSTSTKIGVFHDDNKIFVDVIRHPDEELVHFKRVSDQVEFRRKTILESLKKLHYDIKDITAVVGRGGPLRPVRSGAYSVNDLMYKRLKHDPLIEHASNLGGVLAREIADLLGVSSFIYDSTAVDELEPVARLSGIQDIQRKSFFHPLNMRAVSIEYAGKIGKNYKDLNLIVAHLGGGITLSAHRKGKMIDVICDDEGPFSPERGGRVPCRELIDLCYSGIPRDEMHKKLRGGGGIRSYLGTADAQEVERMIRSNDSKAKLVYESMAYQVSKSIGELATVLKGEVDCIILTGGIAYSNVLTQWITERIKFISSVEIIAGEREMEALSNGVLRVLSGQEQVMEYMDEPGKDVFEALETY